MKRAGTLPGVGWLAQRLERKAIAVVIGLALCDWAAVSLYFVGVLERIYTSADPARASKYAAVSLLGFNLLTLAVAAALLYLLAIRPIIRLRRAMGDYSATGQVPERTGRADEIGRLQNSFVDMVEDLQRKEQAQQRLIASISHDIKTPLTSVLGCAERLRSGELSGERQERYLDLLREKALHLKAVVDEFDDYLDAGLHEGSAMMRTTAGELCRRLEREYGEELRDAGVELTVNCGAEKAEIICNWEQLRRLFGNLISNSMNHGGAAELKLTLGCEAENGRVVFTFRDNGRGVAEERLGQIFEPLYTSDKGRKVSGLGLSICRSIAKAHGGTIGAANAPGGGLAVRLALPRVEPRRGGE